MSIPGAASPLFLSAAAAAPAAAYQIDRSLRFNSADSAYLNRTPSSAGNRKTWTYSTWIKRSNLTAGDYVHVFGHYVSDYTLLVFKTGDDRLQFWTNSGAAPVLETSAVLRDPSAWYHIVLAVDTTQSTASDRAHIYINGVEAAYDVDQRSSQLTQNLDTFINSTNVHEIGGNPSFTTTRYFNGYLAENYLIDGQQLAPTDFGEYDSDNNWNPKAYSGSYGTNGFHLDFSDNSSASALGTDAAGSNDWTVNNISVAGPGVTTTGNISLGSSNRSFYFKGQSGHSLTVASGNFVWDSSDGNTWTYRGQSGTTVTLTSTYVEISGTTSVSFTNASSDTVVYWSLPLGTGLPNGSGTTDTFNIEAYGEEAIDSLIDTPTNYTATSGNNGGNYCTLNSVETGDFATLSNGNLDQTGGASDYSGKRGTFSMTTGKWYWEVTINGTSGVAPGPGIQATSVPNYESPVSTRRTYYNSGQKFNGSLSSYGSSFATGDIIGVAFDADAGSLTFYKNGTSQGVAFSSLSDGPYSPLTADYNGSSTSHNFGQRPFAYTPPTGYLSLCTENLSDPTIADGSTAMDVVTYSGDGTNGRDITGLGFSPDLVWIKARNQTDGHNLFDIVRGTTKVIKTNNSNAELTESNSLTAFNSDGFTVGSNASNAQVNASGFTYVGWTWDGGSSTSSNSDGSITSNVRANASAGFSIVSYTGNGTAGATIGHGLNAAPEFILTKNRDTTDFGLVYHGYVDATAPEDKYLRLFGSGSAQVADNAAAWNDTAPTNSVFTVGSAHAVNESSMNIIAYCWTSVEGFSKFGSFTGNSNNNGPFVYTGFRPRCVVIKNATAVINWYLWDTERSSYNVSNTVLFPSLANAEESNAVYAIDILSNGFKVRTNDFQSSSQTLVYGAWAEYPFKTARAR